ncbi:Alpha/Beta hydrolase protein [Glomus cerebriforme]|uniref:Alpha/Beta hydrolase protein n=1 Tax=Glomus cerebriforme TaxID=658196 RepID=A0A397TVR5_9GLOM|nr:Alpha/Beta hydrolase protein [Glomus cerebriforme]
MPPELYDNELNRDKLVELERDDFIRSLHLNDDIIPTPVVFVEGFMGPSKPAYWGPLEEIFVSFNKKQILKDRRCIFVAPGCGSSLYDRAIEIFYQIKGGRVDYGENHSKKFGHSRYGREYSGLYPEWSVSKPLHFLGHSLGGVTIWKLQQLLANDTFPLCLEPHPDMIRSLTAVSSPFKGSQSVYLLGATTDPSGTVRPFSFGAWLGRFVHIYEYLDIKWLKSLAYDFNVDHWNLSFRKNWTSLLPWNINQTATIFIEESEELIQETANSLCSTYGLLQCLCKSPWLNSVDNGPYDMTIHSMEEVNSTSKTFKNTFYRTYVTSITYEDPITKYHQPKFSFSLPIPIYFLSKHTGSFNFPENTPNPPISRDEMYKWYENDGLCPKYSQTHPHHECSLDICKHHKGLPEGVSSYKIEVGKWDVWEIDNTTHFGLISGWYKTHKQRLFFKGYKEYLDQIDNQYCV